jgi:hypothetical protein
MLATSYFPLASIIASSRLNFCVRNENRCDPADEPPAYNTRDIPFLYYKNGRSGRPDSNRQSFGLCSETIPLHIAPPSLFRKSTYFLWKNNTTLCFILFTKERKFCQSYTTMGCMTVTHSSPFQPYNDLFLRATYSDTESPPSSNLCFK